MHLSTTIILLATALTGASAHPSAGRIGQRHSHVHRAVEARAESKFVKHIQAAAPEPPAPEPTPEPTSKPAPEPTTTRKVEAAPSSPPSKAPSGGKKEFCSGANGKRATLYDISYKGNTGGTGADWGCNIMEVDCSTVDLYDHTAEFTGSGNDDDVYSCSAFNKIGPEGKIDGFWHSALDFGVSGSETVCLAFDSDSQGSVACGGGAKGPPRTKLGQLAGTWAEFDFGSGKNGGQSGADVSVIVADVNKMRDIVGMTISAPGKGLCSKLSMSDPGSSFEVYRGGMEDLDGIGCKGYSKGTIFVTLGG